LFKRFLISANVSTVALIGEYRIFSKSGLFDFFFELLLEVVETDLTDSSS
jgi:hypothetical protein